MNLDPLSPRLEEIVFMYQFAMFEFKKSANHSGPFDKIYAVLVTKNGSLTLAKEAVVEISGQQIFWLLKSSYFVFLITSISSFVKLYSL